MEKYKILEVIGKGSFGEVVKAQNSETGEIVAIKKMKQKFATWDECMNLRELKSLRKLQHKNIVKLKEVLRVHNELSFVFEHVDLDIYKLYDDHKKAGKRLSEAQIKSIFYQLAASLSYMHKHGYFHRDLKPENILYGTTGSNTGMLKLIDFGLAREIRSRPPYTEYVATRWYRAPELLLHSNNYNSPVDIFALGCIASELFTFRPLFNGSSEQDQLNKVCAILGTPSKIDWPEGHRLAGVRGISFPSFPTIPLASVISECPLDALSLISECLRWDAAKRPTAAKVLQHPYFRDVQDVLPRGYFDDEEQQQQTIVGGNRSGGFKSTSENSEIPRSQHISSRENVEYAPAQQTEPSSSSSSKRMSNQYSYQEISTIMNKQLPQPQAQQRATRQMNQPAQPSSHRNHDSDSILQQNNNANNMEFFGKPPLKSTAAAATTDRAKQKESGISYADFLYTSNTRGVKDVPADTSSAVTRARNSIFDDIEGFTSLPVQKTNYSTSQPPQMESQPSYLSRPPLGKSPMNIYANPSSKSVYETQQQSQQDVAASADILGSILNSNITRNSSAHPRGGAAGGGATGGGGGYLPPRVNNTNYSYGGAPSSLGNMNGVSTNMGGLYTSLGNGVSSSTPMVADTDGGSRSSRNHQRNLNSAIYTGDKNSGMGQYSNTGVVNSGTGTSVAAFGGGYSNSSSALGGGGGGVYPTANAGKTNNYYVGNGNFNQFANSVPVAGYVGSSQNSYVNGQKGGGAVASNKINSEELQNLGSGGGGSGYSSMKNNLYDFNHVRQPIRNLPGAAAGGGGMQINNGYERKY